MAPNLDEIRQVLRNVTLADGRDVISNDTVRALSIEDGIVRFVLEAESPEAAKTLEPVRLACVAAVEAMPGVHSVSVVLTAHGSAAAQKPPRNVRIGRHPRRSEGKQSVSGVDRILAVASGKGGVGKSTVATNLAVALAKAGRRVGLLDGDIYGPSVPQMMGVTGNPDSPDGKTIIPAHAHGVTLMSLGLMVEPGQAVVWRGPMLMGALQQLLSQVQWGRLDVLLVDLPPGTGDVQMTLCQRSKVTGAIVVSTPQDVALIDARKAIDMFNRLKTPVLGLIENMSVYICPTCGAEAHIFGHGGVAAEAAKLKLPFLGALPLALSVREAGDNGAPIALSDDPAASAYRLMAERLVAGNMA